MKIKQNKGITMISLVMIVIIMIILASITAYEANNLINIAKVQSVTTDLLLIQAKVRIINEQVVFENDEEKQKELLKGTLLSENTDMVDLMKDNGIIDDSDNIEKYYILSQEDLDGMGLDTINASEGYIVDYDSEEVIYVTGVKDQDGNFLYKLSEMKKEE